VETCVTSARPQGEWDAAVDMLTRAKTGKRRITLAADKAYDDGKRQANRSKRFDQAARSLASRS
jgi:hypothetical protein